MTILWDLLLIILFILFWCVLYGLCYLLGVLLFVPTFGRSWSLVRWIQQQTLEGDVD